MTDLSSDAPSGGPGLSGWMNRLVARPGFQRWAAAFPLTRPFVRRDGAALFGLVQGFVQSQCLFALVELRVLHQLMDHGPQTADALSGRVTVPADRLHLVMQAGAAMGLLKRRRDGRFALARQGAALLGAPGLEQMILHHRVLYRDLENPSAFLRGETTPELAAFWPYVMGATGEADAATTRTYSRLMAESQALVAPETLDVVSLKGIARLMDVGGGSGVFLTAAAARNPTMELALFDLPVVMEVAAQRIALAGLTARTQLHPGSFKTDSLPQGADAISLIRVLYDHTDTTVRDLLAKAYAALPEGGRLIISEPMSGGQRPDPITDVYFAFYTAAMGTGRTRSIAEIQNLCREAGFSDLKSPATARGFVTSVVTAVK